MSARVTIDTSDPVLLRIQLRQHEGEVVRFSAFVLVVVGALYILMPAARSSPTWLMALLGMAAAWSVIALTAREVYTIGETIGAIVVTRSSLLGERRRTRETGEISTVRLAIGGPDANRLLVELVASDGKPRLTIPARITTLGAADQSEIGQAIAERLGVPLRGET